MHKWMKKSRIHTNSRDKVKTFEKQWLQCQVSVGNRTNVSLLPFGCILPSQWGNLLTRKAACIWHVPLYMDSPVTLSSFGAKQRFYVCIFTSFRLGNFNMTFSRSLLVPLCSVSWHWLFLPSEQGSRRHKGHDCCETSFLSDLASLFPNEEGRADECFVSLSYSL